MLRLQRHEELLGPGHHPSREPRQLGHVHAVAPVGAARLEPVQEDHLPVDLADGDVVVPGVLQRLGELHQLVIVGREQHTHACDFVQVLHGRPGDGQTVEGCGASADLVEDHERALGRLIEDRRGLHHLDHERRSTSREIVCGADAAEQPVDHADVGGGGGDE